LVEIWHNAGIKEAAMTKIPLLAKRLLIPALLMFSFSFLQADETTDKVDQIFSPWDKTLTPGCALAVIKDGRIIYERGYGMASLEDGIAMTPDKIFDIGSLSKQFTAACIAILIREGKISLDDDIRTYLPEVPKYERPITIRHLIYHTSGLRDYTGLLILAGFRPASDCPSVEEALEVISRQQKLNHPPGGEYSYTNTGYFLLGQIVERVSGQSLNRFAQEHIFKPLGMIHTLYQDDHLQIIKNRASGYDQAGSVFRFDMSSWDQTGDGNVYTSVEDLFLWDQAFYTNQLGQDLMSLLQTVGTLNSGEKLDYAFGLVITDYKGLKRVSHAGAWAGFRAALIRFPEQRFSAICLANLSRIDPSALCLRVADIYLAGLLEEPPKKKKSRSERVVLTPRELRERMGNYRDERSGAWAVLSVKNGKLCLSFGADEFPLTPTSKTTFTNAEVPFDNSLEFPPVTEGAPLQAVIRWEDEEIMTLVRNEPPPSLTAAALAEYAGEYVSEELLGAAYRLVVGDGHLQLRFRSLPQSVLKAMAPDEFASPALSFDFVRGQGNGIVGLKLSGFGVSGITFFKK
jgi:CubicO group peptidase (beta-lactamase class C family)